MEYREERQMANSTKKIYVDSIISIIEKRHSEAEKIRSEYSREIFKNPEKYRADLKEMLGWPLIDYEPNNSPETEFTKLSDEDGYTTYRVTLTLYEELKLTGLLFKKNGDERKPLIINQHGKLGTPELISGIYENTFNYNDMLQRILKFDTHVFAPQLLLWSDDYDVKYDRVEIDTSLKMVGSSIAAIEIFAIKRIIDYFEAQDYVSNFGMIGMSYGGFYALYTSALETRIKSTISCAYFNKRDAVTWPDWVWENMAYKFDDAQVACLTYPRNMFIAVADDDALFDYKYGIESFNKVKDLSKDVGYDWVDFTVFEGSHEFIKDDEPIRKLVEHISE